MSDTVLAFKDFSNLDSSEKSNSDIMSHSPGSPGNQSNDDIDDDHTKLEINKSFWTFKYYQQFFEVNTDQVKNRIIWSMVPRPSASYIQNYIRPNPDLYGPFWICITLIFTIAVSGNVANYLQFAQEGNFQWKYDFHLISYAATTIFLYASFVPLTLWAFLKWENSLQGNLTFLEILCVYGYSLAIYIPVCILIVIQISWFQWLLVLLSSSLSGLVLCTTISPAVAGGKKILVLGGVMGLHFLLAVGFMLYTFHVPTLGTSVPTTVILSHANNNQTG